MVGSRVTIRATRGFRRDPGDRSCDQRGFAGTRRLVPGWLDAGVTVRAPRRTTRQRFRAQRQDVVGVPASGAATALTGLGRRAGR
jgi:hypothetical protein